MSYYEFEKWQLWARIPPLPPPVRYNRLNLPFLMAAIQPGHGGCEFPFDAKEFTETSFLPLIKPMHLLIGFEFAF